MEDDRGRGGRSPRLDLLLQVSTRALRSALTGVVFAAGIWWGHYGHGIDAGHVIGASLLGWLGVVIGGMLLPKRERPPTLDEVERVMLALGFTRTGDDGSEWLRVYDVDPDNNAKFLRITASPRKPE